MSNFVSPSREPGAPLHAGRTVRAALLLLPWLGLLLLLMPGLALATSLRFFGNGVDDIDRVKIPIDAAGTTRRADVGASDFTLEWWMRALPGENPANDDGCDTNDGWITGNIVFDRDVFNNGDHGDYGVSLKGGRVAFGVGVGSAGNTICGVSNVADGAWHHVAVTRKLSDGRLRIYVDGVLDADGPGSLGDASYRNARPTSYPNSDPFLVIGAEKHDAGPDYPSYSGWIDEIRLSTVLRYTGGGFTRPFSAFTTDGNTAALYHLDEGTGDVVGDASGGNSHGTRMYGGSPVAGPEWSSQAAPLDTARRATLEQVISGAGRPVAIANAGGNDERLFVVDANGRIRAYDVTAAAPFGAPVLFLDITDRVLCCGERGLLGLAFHPSYASNRYFFVFYTAKANSSLGLSDGDLVIARFRAPNDDDPDDPPAAVVDKNTERILLTIDHSIHGNHNGGGLAFGPDGYLYAAVGDGGGGGDPFQAGQNLGMLLGKVLRVAVDVSEGAGPYYTVPSSNPFVDTAGALEEIWAWGLRNPWRMTFDRLTGDLFIADVGQDNREEVNFQPVSSDGGENYGWRRMEGKACFIPGSGCQTGSLVLPILDYGHGEGCSVTGGYRYRGSRLPALNGAYLFGDFCSKKIWVGIQGSSGTWSRQELLATNLRISTFGEDRHGEIYVAHIDDGTIHRLVPAKPRLTATRAGGGAVSISGPGLDCGTACSTLYTPGQTVTLTAILPGSSWFVGWSGACGGTGDCVVVMDGDRTVTATVNPRPTLQFSASNYSVGENGGSATITVQRLVTTAGTTTVDYTIAAGNAIAPLAVEADFAGPGGSLTGTLTFTPGQSTKSFTIPIVNDTRVEGPETVLLSLHNPSPGALLGAQQTAVVTIVDNDAGGQIRWSTGTYTVNEGTGAGAVTLTATRSGGSAGNVSVAYTIAGGTATAGPDFTGPLPDALLTGTLDFPAGTMSRTLTLPIVNDGAIEPNEAFTVTLHTPHGGATVGSPQLATVTIVDNDRAGTVQFSTATVTAPESAATVTLTVTRTGSTSAAASVAYALTGPATALVNGALTGTVDFGSGHGSRPLTIALLPDTAVNGNSTLTVTLTQPVTGGLALGTPNPATVVLVDDEGTVQFAAATYSASEGSGSVTLTLTRTGGTAKAVTVTYATGAGGDTATAAPTPGACVPGADYRPVAAGTVTFSPGQTSRTISVPLCGDSLVEAGPPETFSVRLTGVSLPATLGAPSTAVVAIQDNDGGGTVRFSSATAAATEGTAEATLTVLRTNGPAGNVQVPWSLGGSAILGTDYASPTTPNPLVFGPNQSSATIKIPILNDGALDGFKTLVVTLGAPTGGAVLGAPGVTTLTIHDNEPSVRFAQPTYTVGESSTSVNVTVQRLGATSPAVSVTLETTGAGTAEAGACASNVADHPPVSVSVLFLSGQTIRTVSIPLCLDTVADGSETIGLALVTPAGATLGSPSTATIQINDNDVAGRVQFAAAAGSASDAQDTATVLVTRTGGSATAVTAHWTIVGGTAAPEVDYEGDTSGTVTFGQSPQPINIALKPRPGPQGPRTITLVLDSAGGGGQLGTLTTTTLWILDGD